MGMKVSDEMAAEILRRATNVGPTAKLPGDEPPKGKPLVTPRVAAENFGVVAYLPIETASEINGRDWRKRSKRTDKAWRVVSRTFGPSLVTLGMMTMWTHREGRALRVTLTRLGGRRLDAANLPTALKATEDALAFLCGLDDGDPRWVAKFEQDPDFPEVGVRVTITDAEGRA
jgi:hypothetical protein